MPLDANVYFVIEKGSTEVSLTCVRVCGHHCTQKQCELIHFSGNAHDTDTNDEISELKRKTLAMVSMIEKRWQQ